MSVSRRNKFGLPTRYIQQEVILQVQVMPPFDLHALKDKQIPITLHCGRTSVMGVATVKTVGSCSVVVYTDFDKEGTPDDSK